MNVQDMRRLSLRTKTARDMVLHPPMLDTRIYHKTVLFSQSDHRTQQNPLRGSHGACPGCFGPSAIGGSPILSPGRQFQFLQSQMSAIRKLIAFIGYIFNDQVIFFSISVIFTVA